MKLTIEVELSQAEFPLAAELLATLRYAAHTDLPHLALNHDLRANPPHPDRVASTPTPPTQTRYRGRLPASTPKPQSGPAPPNAQT
jgi:hypothetical protein